MIDDKGVEIQDVLLRVIRALVEKPEDVELTSIPSGETVVFRVQANPSDIGKLIGKSGRTARALRVILAAAGQNFRLDIKER